MKNILKNSIIGLSMMVAFLLPSFTSAVSPSDYNLWEGDVIRAEGDIDIYIVNENGYKRLFLNPEIFDLYGHIGWDSVKTVSPETRDAFPTSGLFRVGQDEKVYGLDVDGEDSAVLRWIDTTGEQAVLDDPDFFEKVFVINDSEKALYQTGAPFISVNQVPDYSRFGLTETVTNKVVVDTVVSSQTITWNASAFTMLNVKFEGNGDVDSLTLKRIGFGTNEDYKGVYLVKDGVRITNSKTFPTSGDITFNGLDLTAPFVLSVVADFAGEPSNIAKVELQGVYSGLPLQSNSITFAGVDSGDIAIKDIGVAENVVVGQENAKVGEFKITAGDEKLTLQKLYLYNSGSADIFNVKLVVDDTTYTSSLRDNKYLFNLDISIKNNRSEKFEVFADIDTDARDTEFVRIILDEDYDLVAVGNVYGFGVSVVNNFRVGEKYNIENGEFTVENVKVDNLSFLFGDADKTILEFTVDPEGEGFDLKEVVVNGLDDELVETVYLYQGNEELDSVDFEDFNEGEATFVVDSFFDIETGFTIRADFYATDDETELSFTPGLVEITAEGVNSESEFVDAEGFNGEEVTLWASFPYLVNTSTTATLDYEPVEKEVLRFEVTARGGDIRFTEDSWAFDIDIEDSFRDSATFRVEIDGEEIDLVGDSLYSGDGSLTISFADEAEVLEDETIEVVLFVELSNKTNRGDFVFYKYEFRAELSEIQWESKDGEGEYVEETLTDSVEIEGAHYIERN